MTSSSPLLEGDRNWILLFAYRYTTQWSCYVSVGYSFTVSRWVTTFRPWPKRYSENFVTLKTDLTDVSTSGGVMRWGWWVTSFSSHCKQDPLLLLTRSSELRLVVTTLVSHRTRFMYTHHWFCKGSIRIRKLSRDFCRTLGWGLRWFPKSLNRPLFMSLLIGLRSGRLGNESKPLEGPRVFKLSFPNSPSCNLSL